MQAGAGERGHGGEQEDEPAGDDRGEAAAGERGSGGGRGHAAQGRTGGRRARGSQLVSNSGVRPRAAFGFRNTVGDDAPPPALHAPRPGGRRGRDRHRRAAAHRAHPRPARRRGRAAGPAAVARRVGRLRRRGADPRPRGDLLPGRDRQRDRRPGVRLLGRVPDRAGRVGRVRADRVLAGADRRAPARGAVGGGEAGRERRRADRPLRRARAAVGPAGPVRPVQPRRLPGGRGARTGVAIHVDDVRGRAADHRRRHVPRARAATTSRPRTRCCGPRSA